MASSRAALDPAQFDAMLPRARRALLIALAVAFVACWAFWHLRYNASESVPPGPLPRA
jgi:hypothetical protein